VADYSISAVIFAYGPDGLSSERRYALAAATAGYLIGSISPRTRYEVVGRSDAKGRPTASER
jgi:hypothetical protein